MTNAIIAIVGRTNVGKSTLLNRLSGSRKVVVADQEGITRDRISANINYQDRDLTFIDTGGWQSSPSSILEEKVQDQVELAISQADVILFVVDAKIGLIAADEEVCDALRRSNKPTVLVVNKVDSHEQPHQIEDFFRLNMGTPIAISAYHNLGITDLMETVIPLLPPSTSTQARHAFMSLSIVGRPNVGKSTLLNTLLGTERVIVNDMPGTTRDAIDVEIGWNSKRILLIDTAGIKRHDRMSTGIPFYSFIRALQAINRGDIALLVLDATEFITMNDLHIINYAIEARKSLILLVNKWDLIPVEQRKAYKSLLNKRIKFFPYIPILYLSAKLKQGTGKVLSTAYEIWQERIRVLKDSEVDKVLKQAFESNPPHHVGLKQLQLHKAYQSNTNPPTFTFEVNNPRLAYTSYKRYLEKQLRVQFPFPGTPLQIIVKKSGSQRKRKERLSITNDS